MKLKHKFVEIGYKILGVKGLYRLHIFQHKKGVECWAKEPVIFLHVPKTAGTSINQAFGLCDIGHVPYKYLISKDVGFFDQNKKYFVVYRNPVDRLVSTYKYAKKKKPNDGPSVLFWVRGCETFKDFIAIVYEKKLYEKHYFFWSTSKFIEGLQSVAVLPFDNLNSAFHDYVGEGGIKLPHSNVSSGEKISIDVDDKTVLMIMEMYEDDYRLGDKVKAANGQGVAYV